MKLEYLYKSEDLTADFITYKMLQWKDDPFLWMCEQVFTVDESDRQSPIKRFPPKRYIKELIDAYFNSKILVVCKSRRMMATHVASALMLHQLLFVPYSENIIVSINEDRAKKVISSRCAKMYEFLDKRFPYPVLREGHEIRVSEMRNPSIGSTLTALPSGSDKCRGLTITNGVYDEFAFQDNCEENLKALKPALEGSGCRGMIISTPKFNTKFQELVTKVKKNAGFKELCPGLTLTQNDLNHNVIFLHYTSDKNKRSEEWLYRERYGTTPDGTPIPGESGVDAFTWEQEYELSFTVPTGKPVIPEFSKALHCVPYDEVGAFIPEKPLHVGIDFGSYSSAVFFQADSLNRAIIHNALLVEDEEFEAFMIRLRDFIAQEFPDCPKDNILLYADPAGSARNSQNTAAPAIKLLERFFKKGVRHSKSSPIDRARAIRNKFSKRVGDAMGVIVNPSAGIYIKTGGEERHGLLVEALTAGWIYKKPKEGKPQEEEPYKDGFYEHMMDALGYAFIHVFPTLYEKAVTFRTGRTRLPVRRKKYLRR